VTVAILVRRALARPGQHDEEQILGPCERGALGLGLTLAEARGADAIAIAVGPARREDRVLAMALRAGCARALRVWDDGLEDLDYLGLAEVLAAAAKDVGATIVVCGDRSVDERVGALGPAVAEVLGVAHVSGVIAARSAASWSRSSITPRPARSDCAWPRPWSSRPRPRRCATPRPGAAATARRPGHRRQGPGRARARRAPARAAARADRPAAALARRAPGHDLARRGGADRAAARRARLAAAPR
jgi:hypothetical protein